MSYIIQSEDELNSGKNRDELVFANVVSALITEFWNFHFLLEINIFCSIRFIAMVNVLWQDPRNLQT